MHSIFFIFTPLFPTKEKLFLFHLWNIICRTVDKNVGAGIDTLMSISDGLGPSIFCRKMEKACPMSEEMDRKVVYFPPESAVLPLMLYFQTVLLPICTLTWRVNNTFSRQEKVKIGRMKIQLKKTLQNLHN